MNNKRKIIFISRCPGLKHSQEGMMQRIANIENSFDSYSRIYLDIYLFKFFIPSIYQVDSIEIHQVNILSFWRIYKILRQSDVIYIHSIYFVALALMPLIFAKKNRHIVLDLHGAVPEELRFEGKLLLAPIFSVIEKIAFKIANTCIYVTKNMQTHFAKKYPKSLHKKLVYSIFTSNVCKNINDIEIKKLKNLHNIIESEIIFIYSGSIHKWQNIDLMLDTIRSISHVKNYRFFILTLQVDEMRGYLNKYNLSSNTNIFVGSAKPDELGAYYTISNYGFVLRDEHTLNRVANPTKLVEYLYYGLTPIVKSSEIGDFCELGYETVNINNVSNNMKSIKSNINKNIARNLLIANDMLDLSKSI